MQLNCCVTHVALNESFSSRVTVSVLCGSVLCLLCAEEDWSEERAPTERAPRRWAVRPSAVKLLELCICMLHLLAQI